MNGSSSEILDNLLNTSNTIILYSWRSSNQMKKLVLIATILILASPGEAQRRHRGPMPGEMAPDFTLSTKDGKQKITLSEMNKKPTVLIFASYT